MLANKSRTTPKLESNFNAGFFQTSIPQIKVNQKLVPTQPNFKEFRQLSKLASESFSNHYL